MQGAWIYPCRMARVIRGPRIQHKPCKENHRMQLAAAQRYDSLQTLHGGEEIDRDRPTEGPPKRQIMVKR